jgi:hypothetical protein
MICTCYEAPENQNPKAVFSKMLLNATPIWENGVSAVRLDAFKILGKS